MADPTTRRILLALRMLGRDLHAERRARIVAAFEDHWRK